ncbi:probable potassium transporter 11 [Physcomitrium patens]|uniref:Potassium transporter n=2 Tax=Physcomitrium patens TaxID=3218 RepID=A5PH38_PHYPA|nr:probable potassium transporter 11 [Physcomitrium patens]CAM88968.1 HAK4 putative potassium transporter [Physcomitrium patens]|eukprot:XP_024370150.1 probable potassium transporter 11 [Physcomitrella patens]
MSTTMISDDLEGGRSDDIQLQRAHRQGRLWDMDQRIDQPLGVEADHVKSMYTNKAVTLGAIMHLAYQSLGVVYGDLGTSPLYVFKSTFANVAVTEKQDIIGALSLIIYTLTIIPLIKYVFIVLRANDNGEGGSFALYSLLCRYCNISLLPNQHPTDVELTTYLVDHANQKTYLQRKLEGSPSLQKVLLLIVLLGTCMVIGDGILTPSISVLSSVVGIRAASSSLDTTLVTVISLVILVILFSLQRYGTATVSVVFAPIFMSWFIVLALLGCYNIIKWDKSVFQAFSPHEIIRFFTRNGSVGWENLGGIVLCMTGTEALFADLGHFSFRSIQMAFTSLVYPCLILTYLGQAAYLVGHTENVNDPFYSSLPPPLYWPIFVLATVSAMIASQAIISATFSIVKQSVALGCFPRVKIVHTSNDIAGRVYIPEINWILMGLCLVITAGFRDTNEIGNAYGIAVVVVMIITTILMTLVMIIVWRKHVLLALLFFTVFMAIEVVYLSAVLFKITQGGWVPLAIAVVFGTIMYTWHYGTLKRYQYEMQHKVSVGWLLGLGPSLGLVRVPGIGLMYTDLAHGVPPLFSHFITNLPAIHSTVVFVCIKYLPVNTVPQEERFLIRRIGTRAHSMYRCAARYGYKDIQKKDDNFEQLLIHYLTKFIEIENFREQCDLQSMAASWTPEEESVRSMPTMNSPNSSRLQRALRSNGITRAENSVGNGHLSQSCTSLAEMPTNQSVDDNSQIQLSISGSNSDIQDEVAFLNSCKEAGVVYILGNNIVKARKDSGLFKKLIVNFIYTFLRRISRDSRVVLNIPHECLLQVGMVYYV